MTYRLRPLFLFSAMLCVALFLRAQLLHADGLEDHGQKNFNVGLGGTLNFDSEYGSVTVKTGEAGGVTIQVDRKVEASTTEEAKRILDDLEIVASQEGDTIHYRARFRNGWQSDVGEERNFCHDHRCLSYARNLREMSFTITVPKQFNLDLSTEGGHVEIGDIEGKIQAETSGGHISVGNVVGPVNVRTAGGHVDLASAKGRVEIQTAGGHIHCGDVEGDVDAQTAGGGISLGKVKGKVEAKTAGGGIEISGAGDSIQARTAGGSIRAQFTAQPNSDSYFETVGGGIRLQLPADIRANLDVRGSRHSGRIHSDFPVTMETSSEGELQGTINGGGPAIKVRNHSGNIEISKSSD